MCQKKNYKNDEWITVTPEFIQRVVKEVALLFWHRQLKQGGKGSGKPELRSNVACKEAPPVKSEAALTSGPSALCLKTPYYCILWHLQPPYNQQLSWNNYRSFLSDVTVQDAAVDPAFHWPQRRLHVNMTEPHCTVAEEKKCCGWIVNYGSVSAGGKRNKLTIIHGWA